MANNKIEITGLRKRWLVSSLSPIFVVALLIAGTFCVVMANYYYNMMLDGLKTRAAHASEYFSSNAVTNFREFYQSASSFASEFSERDIMELQFINSSGRIMASSYGLTAGMAPGTPDIINAFQTKKMEPFRGVDPHTGEHIMSVCAPLLLDDQVVGAMRYVTSMSAVTRELLITVGVALGLLIVGVGMVYVSNMVFINNVVEPVAEVTETAKRIAGGSYGTQMENHYRDEIGQLIDAINNMSAQISKSEKVKSEFISSVSHELRTPLTAINGWGETLLEDDDPQQLQRGVSIILKESRRLTNMVEELLDFSKMQDGRFTLNIEPVDVQAEFEDTIYTYMELFKQDHIELHYEGSDELFPPIPSDPERLKQVFCNVLDNAAKHGGAGRRIDAAVTAGAEAIVITVRDYGPGIPEAELPFVKQKFYKGSSKARGSGIGLAVCDEIIRLHEGTFSIGNAEGGGCLVTITLPAE
ncbi:MAG: HAMP domain-containing histidine kinase [Oscillospiraceae bacterium]|jgi:two-component system OmpR family sensor kinase|nr:HAMP domain-containing histidine kinase [Oscillospiraceae bacterium]MCI8943048.1 HAMP domain-containing histidine kinase [Oscillospiraceae bacterium]